MHQHSAVVGGAGSVWLAVMMGFSSLVAASDVPGPAPGMWMTPSAGTPWPEPVGGPLPPPGPPPGPTPGPAASISAPTIGPSPGPPPEAWGVVAPAAALTVVEAAPTSLEQ